MTVTTRGGHAFGAARVIVTLPPTLAGRLEYRPTLPSWRGPSHRERLPAGSVIKCYAVYPEPFWRAQGLTGQAASDQGPIKITFDNSPPSGTPGVLMGFMEANDYEPPPACPSRAPGRGGGLLRPLLRGPGRRTHRVHRAGLDAPRSSAVVATAPTHPGGLGRVRCRPHRAGRPGALGGAECSPVWNGYMEGAVRSGEQTAHDVLATLS